MVRLAAGKAGRHCTSCGNCVGCGRYFPFPLFLATGSAMLNDTALDTLFYAARTHNGWQQREVSDAQLEHLFDLLKWAPTSANGSPCSEINTSRPCFFRAMRPALSRSLRCLVTAFSAVSNRLARSVNRAGPRLSCSKMALREGCDSEVRTAVSWSMHSLHHKV